MEITALKAAISYESKLVRRNWLFYFFIFGVLGILSILIPWTRNWISWENIAFASSIPIRGAYFLNLFQALIVIFIICDIERKRRKAETREVFSARPIGNRQSLLGEFLGILVPFGVVDIIFMIACVVIGIIIPDSPIDLWVNLFYLLTLMLPTLVFIIGLSLLVNKLFKQPFISWVILTSFLYFACNYWVTPLYGILDFRGSILPISFSTLIGFVYLGDYLLQRIVFLFLGISFLCFAVLFTKRKPNTSDRKHYLIVSASLFLILALVLGGIYVGKFQARLENRIAYRETFLKYNEYPTSRVLTHDVTYHPGGEKFSATSRMSIQNRQKVKMDKLLLFLNPGLEIGKIESNGQILSFSRDYQVIVIDHPLAPGEEIELEVEYEGRIDEDIYQVNIPDDEFFSPAARYSQKENYGRRRAFVSSGFTLLVPEVMWYPMTVPPVELQASKEINFTDYTLHVKNPGEMTVLSQGTPTREGENVTFNNLQNLTGLSLCMGMYEKRAVTVDSVTIEFYTYPGNDFYLEYFDEWDALGKDNPDREKKLVEIVKRCKDVVEDGKPNPYPFKYLKLIEVPSSLSLLVKQSFSNNVQPEIVFFGERLCKVETPHPGFYTGEPDRGVSVQDFLLDYKIPFDLNWMGINYLFSNYSSSITSDTYRGIELIFREMINPQRLGDKITPKMLDCIAEKGLEGVVSEEYSREQSALVSLKVSSLLGYLTTITTWDSLTRFMQEFNASTRFREAHFDAFIEGFEQRFGQDIKAYMNEWYTSKQVPLLTIKDVSRKTTDEMQVIDFKVGNFSDTDGVVSITTSEYRIGSETISYCRSYLIKSGECKRIIMHEDIDKTLQLTTNFSGCFPRDISFDNRDFPLSGAMPAERVTLLERNQFYPPREIVVDNEDENFHLIDSSNNRKRLADLIKKENEEKYVDLHKIKANTWNLSLSQEFCGGHIRSGFIKKAGTGKCKAEWVANLSEPGKYEIFIHRPHIVTYGEDSGTTDYPGMKNYYTVYTLEGEKEIVLEVPENDGMPVYEYSLSAEEAWVSLGTFTLSAGESRVVLDDRGVAPITDEKFRSTYHQLVVADAVKWVKIK